MGGLGGRGVGVEKRKGKERKKRKKITILSTDEFAEQLEFSHTDGGNDLYKRIQKQIIKINYISMY